LNRISITATPTLVTVRFAGIPEYTYTVQRAPSTSGPWTTVGSITVPDSGIATFEDSSPLSPMGFYRTFMP